MSEKILIAQSDTARRKPLGDVLRRAGYFVLQSSDLCQTAQRLGEYPALVLLDAELAVQDDPEPWSALARDCQMLETPCLVFASNGLNPACLKDLAPWAAGVIYQPGNGEAVLSSVEAQLTISRLQYERDQAQQLLVAKQRQLNAYRRSAAEIQGSLLPQRTPRLKNLRSAWRFLPCEQVGGDLFNLIQITEDTAMAYLFDVSGHGISSAMVTVSVYQSLSLHTGQIVKRPLERAPFYKILTPAEVLQELCLEYPFERFEKFFTLSYLLLNGKTGELCYSNAGHPPPLLVHKDGSSEQLSCGGPIIGLGGDWTFEEGRVRLAAGDRVYLYSDGIPEYAREDGEFFGEERMFKKLVAMRNQPLERSCDRIIDALTTFGKGRPPQDDLTLVGLEYLG